MSRRTNIQLDADKLRDAAKVMDEYHVPASANVLRVVADAIEAGTRTKTAKKDAKEERPQRDDRGD